MKVIYICSLETRTFFEQMSLLIALPRQGVSSLDVIIPYYPTGTMERVNVSSNSPNVIATAETMSHMLSCIPITKNGPADIHIIDLHTLQNRFYFGDNIRIHMDTAMNLLKDIITDDVVIAFPDDGAEKRFGDEFDRNPVIICGKVRKGDSRVITVQREIRIPKDKSKRSKKVVIVDDMCQSGGTINECRKALVDYGFEEIFVFVAHGVFPNESYKHFMKGGKYEGITKFFVTNSIPKSTDRLKGLNPFEVIDLASDKFTKDIMPCSRDIRTVYVSSTTDVKLKAVKDAFELTFPNDFVRVFSVNVRSGVPEQPVGTKQTLEGARIRHLRAKAHLDSKNIKYDFLISIESGVKFCDSIIDCPNIYPYGDFNVIINNTYECICKPQ